MDSAPKASLSVASSNAKDFSKKKRGNRSAKLKQCKLDARREQWLSLVSAKIKDVCKDEGKWNTGEGRSMLLGKKERDHLEIKPNINAEFYRDGPIVYHCSDTESSPSNSPTSDISVPGSNHSGTTFTSSSGSCSRTSRSSSISSNGCCWGVTREEDDGDVSDGCLDDWEAVADALAGSNELKLEHGSSESALASPLLCKSENFIHSVTQVETVGRVDDSKLTSENGKQPQPKSPANCRAWKAGDAFRLQFLSTSSKQCGLPLNSERRFLCEGSGWECENVRQLPASCPICCEDFDRTDSSFTPCVCGYRLCLFCHKRILEDNGRCPGCRKYYEQDPVQGKADI